MQDFDAILFSRRNMKKKKNKIKCHLLLNTFVFKFSKLNGIFCKSSYILAQIQRQGCQKLAHYQLSSISTFFVVLFMVSTNVPCKTLNTEQNCSILIVFLNIF